MERHAGSLSARWNERFPGFPSDDFPYTSFRGIYYRKHRDAHLKDIIVQSLAGCGSETTIVNPACVFGRHACHLATRLPHVKVIATDIDLDRYLHLAEQGFRVEYQGELLVAERDTPQGRPQRSEEDGPVLKEELDA